MTSIFIVRPFGEKTFTVKDKDDKVQSFKVDFDRVDRDLIQKAVEKNGLNAETTGVITKAGNIRLDMFQMLIAYDLVIADISIDNANAFYELGVRHGLRPNGTILIRFPTSGKDVPFDLKTDRYIEYDRENPAAAVDLLARSIDETIKAMRKPERKPDSPVFLLLPQLKPPDPAKLIVVPRDFQEAAEKAEHDTVNGRATLALLAEEAKRNPWSREGVRLVALAQRRNKTFKSARDSWEFIQRDLPDDIEANLQLATIYQRLGDLVAASQACRHVLDNPDAQRKDRADARSQLARNTKTSWVTDFRKAATEVERRRKALSDSRLTEAFQGYMDGFAEDLNDYYSGINALGLLSAMVKLAEMESATWGDCFETERRAAAALEDYQEQLTRLHGAVRMSLDNARQQAKRSGKPDEWLPASDAQLELLTSNRAARVAQLYQTARNADGAGFSVDSEAQQVAIFYRLGLFTENCRAAMEALGVTPADLDATGGANETKPRDRILVATGHRADAPGRAKARFPNTSDCFAKAKAWLSEAVKVEKGKTAGSISGIGGAASGTDLLFHEVCEELGIPTKVVLPIPIEGYRRESVADGGPDWVEMFNRRVARNPPVILSGSDMLPGWAEAIANYGVFQRGNIWLMEDALLQPNANTTLIALWNGKAGDGPGGTADMVQLARDHGAKICDKDTDELFGLPKEP
jgi:hypothetical protein